MSEIGTVPKLLRTEVRSKCLNMLAVSILYLSTWFFLGTLANDVSPTILTHLGGIKGTYKQSFISRKYEAYEGIPYASPPTMERRFEPPQPIKEWVGNLSATKAASACIQYSHAVTNPQDRVKGDEDCLYLNIYVPVGAQSLPVLFYIHGGGFQFNTALTGAKFLMDRDVIVVTINYRLGSFGFLSTEDAIVLGNMGLKDQSLALRWVSDNIHYFGGDPKKITIMGNSAGGASVHYHYLSPMSRGLFRNGISFSGASLGPGKQTENAREKARKLAALLGCPTENIAEMIECLRYRPARLIAQATKHFMLSSILIRKPWLYNPFTPFGPVVEKVGDRPFINRSPIEIISSGDVADVLWITSLVSEEGLYPAAEFINNDTLLVELNEKWEKIAPHLLDYNYTIPLAEHAKVARQIKANYLGNKAISGDSVKEIIDLVGDRLYAVDGEKAARLQAKVNKSPVLFLYYSYRAHTSYSDSFTRSTTNYGVSHADDIYMLFENRHIYPPNRVEDRAMQMKLIDLVLSVAEKGRPELDLEFEWKSVDPVEDELEFLHIRGPSDIKMDNHDNIGQKNFWSTINFEENKLE